MKKLLLVLAGIMIAFSVPAMQYTAGKQYIVLDKPVTNEPQIMEFFSFFCPHCYEFERVWHIGDKIKKNLPSGVKITKYHVDFLGGDLGAQATHAWAVAMVLGVGDKVLAPLFEGIQKNQTITNEATLKEAFVKAAGIKPEEYDAAWNSFVVKALVAQQQKAAQDVGLKGVPAFYINGKYMIDSGKLDTSSEENYVQDYANLVNFLIKKP